MATYRYFVVDVFTDTPLEGNPLAVFPDPQGLSDELMQKIARELNLAETAFLFPPSSPEFAANVRIFTPQNEMKFAGHPTIGSAYILAQLGRVPRDDGNIVLEEKIGPVPVRFENAPNGLMIWLTTPPITFGAVYDRAQCAKAVQLEAADLLDAPPQYVTAGNPNIYIPVRDRDAVDRAYCDRSGSKLLSPDEPVCIFVFTPAPYGAYSRMFAPELGVPEDPATGSATGPLAAYMMKLGLVPQRDGTRFYSEQGVKMGRRSVLHVVIRGDSGRDGIEIGGMAAPLVDAVMAVPGP